MSDADTSDVGAVPDAVPASQAAEAPVESASASAVDVSGATEVALPVAIPAEVVNGGVAADVPASSPGPAPEPAPGVPAVLEMTPESAHQDGLKAQTAPFEPLPLTTSQAPSTSSMGHFIRTLKFQADVVLQLGKRKKLDKIVASVATHGSITNDQVEKLLHVSDATATRYLSQLVKEGKLKQEGKRGPGVRYIKV